MNGAKATRIARSLSGLDQKELAARAEIDRSYLSMIETGTRKASTKTLENIAAALHLPFHIFVFLGMEREDAMNLKPEELTAYAKELLLLLLTNS